MWSRAGARAESRPISCRGIKYGFTLCAGEPRNCERWRIKSLAAPGDIRVAGCGASESAPGGSALGARLSASGWRRPGAFEGFHYFGRVSPLSGPRPALSQGKAVLYEATTRYLRPGPSER